MTDLIDSAYIASTLDLSRAYVVNTVVKRTDFPAPVFRLSRKTVKWRLVDFEGWIKAQAIRASGRLP